MTINFLSTSIAMVPHHDGALRVTLDNSSGDVRSNPRCPSQRRLIRRRSALRTAALGGGLRAAKRRTDGLLYGGTAEFGDVIRFAPVTLTPQAGILVTRIALYGFDESGATLYGGTAS